MKIMLEAKDEEIKEKIKKLEEQIRKQKKMLYLTDINDFYIVIPKTNDGIKPFLLNKKDTIMRYFINNMATVFKTKII